VILQAERLPRVRLFSFCRLNRKEKNMFSLRALRLCGELLAFYFVAHAAPFYLLITDQ